MDIANGEMTAHGAYRNLMGRLVVTAIRGLFNGRTSQDSSKGFRRF
jgi:hypothetical protein